MNSIALQIGQIGHATEFLHPTRCPHERRRRAISVHAPDGSADRAPADQRHGRARSQPNEALLHQSRPGRADRPRVPMSLLRPSRGSPTPGVTDQHGLALALVEPADKFAGWGSWLGSLASACAVSQHQAATGLQAKPTSGAGPQARVGTRFALFERLAISWEWPGLPRPTRSPGRSSAGTAAMPPSPGSGSAAGTGARPSPVLRVCRSRSQSPSPAGDPMAPCSGRPGLPISICGRIAPRGEREPPSERERATTKVTPAKERGSRCHRSGRRRIRRQASLARRASRSRRRRPRAGSNRGPSRPSIESGVGGHKLDLGAADRRTRSACKIGRFRARQSF
jgi:hypothetical protein